MGRGRPKGSKNRPKINLFQTVKQEEVKIEKRIEENAPEIVDNTEGNVNTPEEKKSIKTNSKALKPYGICNKCGASIYMSPVAINLSHLTGKASWHRRCKLERIVLCNSCGSELNNLIDNWILKDHPEYVKWDISEKEF